MRKPSEVNALGLTAAIVSHYGEMTGQTPKLQASKPRTLNRRGIEVNCKPLTQFLIPEAGSSDMKQVLAQRPNIIAVNTHGSGLQPHLRIRKSGRAGRQTRLYGQGPQRLCLGRNNYIAPLRSTATDGSSSSTMNRDWNYGLHSKATQRPEGFSAQCMNRPFIRLRRSAVADHPRIAMRKQRLSRLMIPEGRRRGRIGSERTVGSVHWPKKQRRGPDRGRETSSPARMRMAGIVKRSGLLKSPQVGPIWRSPGDSCTRKTVAQNIFLTREPRGKLGCVDDKIAERETKKLFEDLGVEIDPSSRVEELGTAYWQLVEIAKALAKKARVW
ncbi:hypothetical protein FQR65_LT20619 [Abscondita terminalis]|nr:hypothetical protein FQR65_LT20619 [Abscondita terminalis]